MEIYLIRHTRPQAIEGICYGRSDVALGRDFPDEAQEMKQRLSSLANPAVYSSPSTRCLALARVLSPGKPILAPALQEMDFGSWEMKPWDSIPRETLDAWAEDYMDVACPQGECLRDLIARVISFWKEIVAQEIPEALLVTHAGPIRVLLSFLLEIPPREMFSRPVHFGGIWKITCKAGFPSNVSVFK